MLDGAWLKLRGGEEMRVGRRLTSLVCPQAVEPAPANAGQHPEEGFTLIELVIVLFIIPLVIGAIAVVMITSLKATSANDPQGTATRLADSHDAASTSVTFVRDVQSALVVYTGGTLQCGSTGTQVLGLTWSTPTTSGIVNSAVSYAQITVGGSSSPEVVRNYCSWTTTPTTIPSTTVGVVHDNSTTTNPTVTFTCSPPYSVPPNQCGIDAASALGAGVAEIYEVTVKVTEQSGFVYTLTATPRIFGTIPSPGGGGGGPPLLLLGGGNDVVNCKGSLAVNGQIAVNSMSSSAITVGGSFTAQQVYSQYTGGSDSSPNYTPTSSLQPAYMPGPVLSDPYATLPPPSTSGLPVHNTTAYSGPGIYTQTLTFAGSSNTVMADGIYILEAGMTTTGSATQSSASTPGPGDIGGVLLWVTGGNVVLHGSPTAPLSAPTTGTYKGILLDMRQDPTGTLTVHGTSTTDYNGVIDAPNQTFTMGGTDSFQALSVVAKAYDCNGSPNTSLIGPPVTPTQTTSSLISSANPSNTAQSVTFTATVSSGSPTVFPAGTVTFSITDKNNNPVNCQTTNTPAISGTDGTAKCTVPSAFNPGASPYTVVASYAGNVSYGPWTATLTQTVNPGPPAKFLVSPSTSTPTAGTPFTVSLTAQDSGGATATSYTGSETIAWSGANTSPGGNAPSYPTTTVAFANGVSTTPLTITLYASGLNTITATASSPTLTGSATVTVAAAGASNLAWVATSNTHGTLSGSCYFTCVYTSVGGPGTTFKAKVILTDLYGNPVSNTTGSAISVTVNASLGSFSGSATVSIPKNGTTSNKGGDSSNSGEVTFNSQNGSWATDTLSMTNTGSPLTPATASFSK